MIYRHLILKLLAAASLGFVLSAPPPSLAADTGWKLEQTGDYLGPMTVYVSKKALKIDVKRYAITFCISSPEYQVLGYNDKTRSYFSEKYDVWKKRFLAATEDTNHAPHVQQGTSKLGQFKVKRYLLNTGRAGAAPNGPEADGKRWNTEMFVTDDIKTPNQFVALMTSIAYLPSNLGYPLKVVRHTPLGAEAEDWKTLSVAKATVPEQFAVPKGYRQVDTELALFVGTGEGGNLSQSLSDDSLGLPIGEGSGVAGKARATKAAAGRWAPGFDSVVEGARDKAPGEHGTKALPHAGGWAPGF